MCCAAGGAFLLRVEDIDQTRARAQWEAQTYDDLAWLGIKWEPDVLRQSENMAAYSAALQTLWARGLLYPCGCNRRDIKAAATAPQEGAPLVGPDGIVYPGTCRHLPKDVNAPLPTGTALRLDLQKAAHVLPDEITFDEALHPPTGSVSQTIRSIQNLAGDVVLARRDMGTSYHLSVVLDDAAQGITDVVRGADLFEATALHVVLQELLDLPTPRYHHHRLIRDADGKRLAKRDDARAISKYRAEGATPQDIRAMFGLQSKPRAT